MPRSTIQLAIAAAILGGCAGEPGDLDADVVNKIATDQGDAIGDEWSGIFAGELRPINCGCEELAVDEDNLNVSLCALVTGLDFLPVVFEVVHADGIILADIGDGSSTTARTLTGPIDQDGTFSAGSVFNIAPLGHEIIRADGRFENVDGTVSMRSDLRLRFTGSGVDCSEEHVLSGERTP